MRTWTSPNDAAVYDLDRVAALRRECSDMGAGLQFQIHALIDGHWHRIYWMWDQDTADRVHAELMWEWAGDPS